MGEQRFRPTNGRWVWRLQLALGAVFLVSGIVGLVAVGPGWLVVLQVVTGVLHVVAASTGRLRHLLLTTDELVIRDVFRDVRVPWDDVERVHLDWAAEAAGRSDVLRVDRVSSDVVRSAVVAGLGDPTRPDRERLTTALGDHAARHGFEVVTIDPPWRRG